MRASRCFGVAALVLSLVSGLIVGLPPAVVAAVEPMGEPLEASVAVSPIAPVSVPASVPAAAMPVWSPVLPVWPSAGSVTVDLAGSGAGSAFSEDVPGVAGSGSPGGLPVTVTVPLSSLGSSAVVDPEVAEQWLMRGRPVPGTFGSSGSVASVSRLTLSTLDQAGVSALGVRGVVLSVASADGPVSSPSLVGVQVSYALFAGAFGGGYADRLRLVRLPGCALTTPLVAACQQQRPVPDGRNVVVSRSVSGVVDLGAAGSGGSGVLDGLSEPVVLAVTAGASSEQGDWKATSLSQTGSWQAGQSGGDFTYSVAVPVPPAPGGLVPEISLGYSSGSVDGLTKSTTSQTSWIGEGWDYHPGFVERQYRTCFHDGEGPSRLDLCWVAESPVVASLGGVSTRLFYDSADAKWKAEDDSAGWKVDRLFGLSNGARLGEGFKITTRDGTQYWFGSREAAASGGVLNAEVFGNNVGEPCYHAGGFGSSHCQMPYRWNLDRIQDVHGNVVEFMWNHFRGLYGADDNSQVMPYDIYGQLAMIYYGANVNSGSAGLQHTGKVVFNSATRCLLADCNPNVNWPDTPWDQYCALGSTSCPGRTAPTFWSLYRLETIDTFVWDSLGGLWAEALTPALSLGHMFPATPDEVAPAGSDSSPALWLSHVSAEGMPTMVFSGEFKRNRVDWGGAGNVPAMARIRISHIDSGHGQTTTVGYTGEDCWTLGLPAQDDENNRRCFPQLSSGVRSWWHKYVVTDVTEFDGYSGVGERWHYDYSFEGSSSMALWKHDQAWHTPPVDRTWSRWAGYPTVQHWHGNPDGSGVRQATETLFYRGMNGDKTAAGGWNSRVVTLWDGWDSSHDWAGLEGTVRRTLTLDGPGYWPDKWKQVTRYHHAVTVTGSATMTANPTIWALRTRQTKAMTQTVLAGPTYRYTETETLYESVYGLATKVTDRGDTSTGADDRCTMTEYATANTSLWLVGLPKQSVTTDCATTPTAANVLAASRSIYDTLAYGAAPTRGLVTLTQSAKQATAYPPAAANYIQSGRSTYDAYGRTVDAFDALDDKTTTGYTPSVGGPVSAMSVTGKMGAGWTVNTTLDTRFGVPTMVSDVNGRVTRAAYDEVGRLSKVWKNHRAPISTAGVTPDVEYGYSLGPMTGTGNWVSTKTLGPDGQQILAYQIFDGRLRARQSQTLSATGSGRTLTLTMFNQIGQVASESSWFNVDSPNTTLVGAADINVKVQQRFVYDNLGRATNVQQWAGDGTVSSMLWETISSFDGDKTVTVMPPAGGTATTTVTDGRGRTTQLWQYHSFADYLELVAGDYTGDGKTDMFAIQPGSGKRLMFHGNGDNTFTPSAASTESGLDGLRQWVSGRFDNNTNLDAAAIRKTDGALIRYQGNGAGALATPTQIATGFGIYSELAAGDFNADGYTDLVAVRASDGMAHYLRATTGGGSFQTPVNLGTGWSGHQHLVAADANGDGKTDLLAIRTSDLMLRRALGNGNGTFAATTDLSTGWKRANLAAGDFDNDGKADLFGANPPSDRDPLLTRFKGNGTTFISLGSLPLSAGQAYDATSYGYDRLDRLTAVADPAGNAWSYTYDLLGRKTQTVDPDAGTSTTVYDNAGQVTSTTDGRGQQLHYTYDPMGRKKDMRADTAVTGPLRATWTYDSAVFHGTTTVVKGQLASTTRHETGPLDYTQTVGSYDNAYRPRSTTTSIPGMGTAGGTLPYTVGTTYKSNGALDTQTLPAVGGLPAETLTHAYHPDTGLPTRLTTSNSQAVYLDDTKYHYDGLIYEQYLGATGKHVKVQTNYNNNGRRRSSFHVNTETPGDPDDYGNTKFSADTGFDPAGNLVSIQGFTNQAADQRECFRYDSARRLTEAWTQTSGTCTTPQRTGADPYWRQWTFDTIGNRLTQTDKNPATGDTTWTSTVGTAAGVKPHQVASVTSTGPLADTTARTFGYDNAGNTTTRTTPTGGAQTLTWDKEGHLATLTEAGQTTSYTYDTAGTRLITSTPSKKTLYLPDGTELEKIGTADPLATRHYGVAVRDTAGLRWTIPDHHGTATAQIDPTTLAINRHHSMPYGEDRTTPPTGWKGTKGYIGGTKDPSGLTHLSAREYDPTLGRFISVDPIMDVTDPQQWHGYAYANNSPATFSDPTGLYFFEGVDGDGQHANVVTESDGTRSIKLVGSPKRYTVREDARNKRDYLNIGFDVPSYPAFIEEHFGTHITNLPDETAGKYYSYYVCIYITFECSSFDEAWAIDVLSSQQAQWLELTGYNDAVECANGQGMSCVGTALSFIPWGKLGKLLKLGRAAREASVVGSFGSVPRSVLEAAATSGGPTTRVVTNLTQAPQAGRALSAATGDAADALAGTARAEGTLYIADIPNALLRELERVGLVQYRTTSMGGVVGTEIRFMPNSTEFVAGYFGRG